MLHCMYHAVQRTNAGMVASNIRSTLKEHIKGVSITSDDEGDGDSEHADEDPDPDGDAVQLAVLDLQHAAGRR